MTKRNFILQQGLADPGTKECGRVHQALMFQPRVISMILLAGIIFQSQALFMVLSALLWWSAAMPEMNPFDAVYNKLWGASPQSIRLRPAPGPRRFAQGMAGTFSLVIGFALAVGWFSFAYIVEGIFSIAVLALVFVNFCIGSFIYYVINGKIDTALRTLPWKRP